MVKDSIKSLREPVAWILVSAVAVDFIVGLWRLLEKPESEYAQENWFLNNSYYGTSSFVGITFAVALVTALLLVTVLPDRLPRAKPVVVVVAIEAGVLLLFGILTMFLGLFYEATSSVSGTSIGPDGGDKAQSFIGNLPSLALTLIPLLLALAMVKSTDLFGGATPPPGGGYYGVPPQQPYQGQPYPQQQQQGFPAQQQGFPGQQQYPGSFPEWGNQPPQQGGGYGQGW